MKLGQIISINNEYFKVTRIMPIGVLVKELWEFKFFIVPHNTKFTLIQEKLDFLGVMV